MSIAAQLKSATDGLHRQTEALMPSAALLDGTMGAEEYGALLMRLYAVHSTLEANIEASLASHPNLAAYYFPKLPWLQEDLAALDLQPPKTAATEIVPMTDASGIVGQLYVLEGSTLGGQVILRGLRKNPALNGLPHRYYTGYGPMTGPKWKAFVEMMEREVPEREVRAAEEGAADAFGVFIRAFEKN